MEKIELDLELLNTSNLYALLFYLALSYTFYVLILKLSCFYFMLLDKEELSGLKNRQTLGVVWVNESYCPGMNFGFYFFLMNQLSCYSF